MPAIHWNLWTRKLHRWGSILIAVPFLVILGTGMLLLLKKEWAWVQPPTQRGKGIPSTLALPDLLAIAQAQPQCGVEGWKDIDRLDIRPDRGIIKLQTRSRWEIQIDLQTTEVLQVAYRRSDLLESLHDGSWFHDRVRLFVTLPVGVVLLTLWLTGLYLFFLPIVVRWSRRRHHPSPLAR
ncbi:MAG: PepSY-associated TM helix domain-containing protein [Gemmataceae bacterium]